MRNIVEIFGLSALPVHSQLFDYTVSLEVLMPDSVMEGPVSRFLSFGECGSSPPIEAKSADDARLEATKIAKQLYGHNAVVIQRDCWREQV